MRDGIFKELPMPALWRQLLRRCERPAERGTRAQEAALRAIVADINKGISKPFAAALRNLAQDRQGQLSVGVPLPDCCKDDGSSLPLERLLKLNLQRQAQINTSCRDVVVAAATDTFVAWDQHMLRHAAQQLSARDRRDAEPALDAASAACAANVPNAVNRLLGEVSAPVNRSRKRFDLDGDLSEAS